MDRPLVLATLGPAGTHSEYAAKNYARAAGYPDPTLIFGQIAQCLALVEHGRAEAAVLPAENLVDGLIGQTFDALLDSQPSMQVFEEVCLPIVHVLAAREIPPAFGLLKVYSHSSALNQCARNLAALAPRAQLIPVGSTAEAAGLVARNAQDGSAAVCSEDAAKNLNLQIVSRDINDYPGNQTRFLVCGRRPALPTGDDRTWVAVHYGRNQPGQLYRTAGAFARLNVDLTSVHSRPFQAKRGSYILLFELRGHQEDGLIRQALGLISAEVEQNGGWVRILGSHPARSGD